MHQGGSKRLQEFDTSWMQEERAWRKAVRATAVAGCVTLTSQASQTVAALNCVLHALKTRICFLKKLYNTSWSAVVKAALRSRSIFQWALKQTKQTQEQLHAFGHPRIAHSTPT